jgi:DNA-binding NarL/FixJ family response regulator
MLVETPPAGHLCYDPIVAGRLLAGIHGPASLENHHPQDRQFSGCGLRPAYHPAQEVTPVACIDVFLAEDHTVVREGLRQILAQQPDLRVVGEAERGDTAVEAIQRLQPDVVVLDYRLPGLNGIEVAAALNAGRAGIKVLILSAYDDVDYVVAALQAGANGYLLKTVRGDELVNAVRAIHAGETIMQPSIARRLAEYWRRRSATSTGDQLSVRELEVLRLLSQGLPNKVLAQRLGISLHTVEGHLASVFGKLGVTSRVGAVLYALRHRLLSIDAADDR